ncbi:amidohydrolase family protein [Terriglobus aquaticus]|uniref:Amidohydrolase family protein n=1 Tax=Terriglobus aquaticus TaxID=940139 RepID=A0ABW9KLQ7_9BACT|nr:amidohydrolase family protein [Terriglobus aquaticus]
MFRIDAHHHLWHYDADEYAWITDDLAPLRRDFVAADLIATLADAGLQGAITVQARQNVKETEWLLQVAAVTPPVLGVVGWLPLRDPALPELLERFSQVALLKGLRHVVQAEPAGFMDDAAFREGLAHVAAAGLTYDLLIVEQQLEEATRLVDAFPQISFVLDHIAKPRMGDGDMTEWSRGIVELARRPNTVCKVSGIVTEASSGAWSAKSLRPYYEVVLDAFTPKRLLFGSDWPVVLARCSYVDWFRIVQGWTADLSAMEQAAIFGENAVRVYGVAKREAATQQGERA